MHVYDIEQGWRQLWYPGGDTRQDQDRDREGAGRSAELVQNTPNQGDTKMATKFEKFEEQ